MQGLRVVAAVLLAVPLAVFGGDHFLGLLPVPELPPSPGAELLVAMREGGLMTPIAVSHLLVALFLLLPTTRFLAGLLQLPMSAGMLAFHFTMMPEGLWLAVVLAALNLIVVADPTRVSFLFAWERTR